MFLRSLWFHTRNFGTYFGLHGKRISLAILRYRFDYMHLGVSFSSSQGMVSTLPPWENVIQKKKKKELGKTRAKKKHKYNFGRTIERRNTSARTAFNLSSYLTGIIIRLATSRRIFYMKREGTELPIN